jgi:predicted metal-dependent hydrolase
MQALIEKAIKLFNQTEYYEAHEVLEEYWKQLEVGDYKQKIQGVIQCAAALHLLQQNRIIGAQKVWLRAQENLANNMDNMGLDNIELDKLIQKTSELLD